MNRLNVNSLVPKLKKDRLRIMGRVGRKTILISDKVEFKIKAIQQNNKCIRIKHDVIERNFYIVNGMRA